MSDSSPDAVIVQSARPRPSRRTALGGLLLTLLGHSRAVHADSPGDAERQSVAERARAAGLGRLEFVTSPRYLVMGDTPSSFLAQALKLCDALARDFLDHFEKKGLPVQPPGERLTVIVLSGPDAYAAYQGLEPGRADGGHYERGTNRLVMFDNRSRGGASAGLARANTIALMHESTHQLAYNTGLLDRGADVPGWLSEGLAMYGEVRSPDGRNKVGAVNRERVLTLVDARSAGMGPSLAELLQGDDTLDAPATEQAAYALSWLLVYHLLQTPERVESLRGYLRVIRTRHDSSRRAADVESAFGDTTRLESELERTLRRIQGRSR